MKKSPTTLKVGDQLTLKVEKLTPNGGRGLSRHEGFVVFTPFVAAGDLVSVSLTKVKKSYAEAKLLELLEPSKDRIDPKCEYFGSCGGCSLQMISIKDQERLKQSFVKEVLERLGLESEDLLLPLISSPKSFRYRNRIQLHQKGQSLGYFKKESHDFVAIEDCLIADEKLRDSFYGLKKESQKRRFELALTKEQKTIVRGKESKDPKELLFSQVNEGVNQKIKAHLKSTLEAEDLQFKKALDLYAGSGNFTEVLEPYFENLKAVELSQSSVLEAQRRLTKTKFVASSVDHFLTQEHQDYDLILADPPRQGLGQKVTDSLVRLKSKSLIYISCNLATLERDLKELLKVYDVSHVQAFDMFPQTSHVETFVHLKCKN